MFLVQYCFEQKITFYFFFIFDTKINIGYQRDLSRNCSFLTFFGTFWTILCFFSISEHFSPLFSILQKLKTMFFPLEDSSRTKKWTLKSMFLWHANPLFQFFVFFQEIIFQPNIALQGIVEILKKMQYLATVLCEHARFESRKSWKYQVFSVLQAILLWRKRVKMR